MRRQIIRLWMSYVIDGLYSTQTVRWHLSKIHRRKNGRGSSVPYGERERFKYSAILELHVSFPEHCDIEARPYLSEKERYQDPCAIGP